MANFLKKITDANFLPGKTSRGNNHYVYSSIFNSLMDKLIPIVTDEKEVTVKKLKYEAISEATIAAGGIEVKNRSGKATITLNAVAGGMNDFRVYLQDALGNNIDLPAEAMIFAAVQSYSAAGIPVVSKCDRPTPSFFTVQVQNVHASDAFNADAVVQYFIINV